MLTLILQLAAFRTYTITNTICMHTCLLFLHIVNSISKRTLFLPVHLLQVVIIQRFKRNDKTDLFLNSALTIYIMYVLNRSYGVYAFEMTESTRIPFRAIIHNMVFHPTMPIVSSIGTYK